MQPTNGHRGIQSTVHLFGLDAGGDQLPGDAQAPRRRIAETESAGVGEQRHIQSSRDLRRDLQADTRSEVVNQLTGCAGGSIGEHQLARRLVTRQVMVDHQFGNRQPPHRLSEHAQSLYIGDVEYNEDVRLFERFRAPVTRVAHVVSEEEPVHLRPRRGIHDLRANSHLT